MIDQKFCIWTGAHSEQVFIYNLSDEEETKRSFESLKRRMQVNLNFESEGMELVSEEKEASHAHHSAPQMMVNDNTLMNVMKMMDDHDKLLHFADND